MYNNDGFIRDGSGYVEVHADGACPGNGQSWAVAGVGVWFNNNHPLNVAARCRDSNQTNNNAELDAANMALEQASKYGIVKLKICTDSMFVINCATEWMTGFKTRGWRNASGQELPNRKQLQLLDSNMNRIPRVVPLLFQYVPAHTGVYGNERADQLAGMGTQMQFVGYSQ